MRRLGLATALLGVTLLSAACGADQRGGSNGEELSRRFHFVSLSDRRLLRNAEGLRVSAEIGCQVTRMARISG